MWTGGTTLTVGNGTLTCRWRYSGGLAYAHYELVRGSTTNAGAGTYSFTLPTAARVAAAPLPLGVGYLRSAAPFAEYALTVIAISETAVALLPSSTTTRVSNAAPFAVVAANDIGDAYVFAATYEPAASIG